MAVKPRLAGRPEEREVLGTAAGWQWVCGKQEPFPGYPVRGVEEFRSFRVSRMWTFLEDGLFCCIITESQRG